jgi:protein involved in polysaccharide export with SLBB domain
VFGAWCQRGRVRIKEIMKFNMRGCIAIQVGVLILTVFLGACQSDQANAPRPDDLKLRERPGSVSRITPIVPGEILDTYVFEDSSFNGQYTVRHEGHIIFPGFGRVVLAGLTPNQAEARLKELLEKGKLRSATVLLDRVVTNPQPLSATTEQMLVYFTGKVVRPGQHALTVELGGNMGAYEAILVTGGLARFADQRHSYVLRQQPAGQPKRKIALDLKSIAEGTTRDLPLRPGDIVYVPEKIFGF